MGIIAKCKATNDLNTYLAIGGVFYLYKLNKAMEITTEIKAKVFAQHLGKYIIHNGKKYRIKGVYQDFRMQWFIIGYNEEDFETHLSVDECKFVSFPLSAITDEDAIEGIKLVKWAHTSFGFLTEHSPIEKIKDSYIRCKMFPYDIYQYLQSKGYDLPNYHLGGKTLHEEGLCIYE